MQKRFLKHVFLLPVLLCVALPGLGWIGEICLAEAPELSRSLPSLQIPQLS